MLDRNKSILLFLIGCIVIRLLFILAVKKINTKYLIYLGLFFVSVSISFLILYFSKSRLEAPEGGGKTWWNKLRLVHGLLYLAAGIFAIQGKREAWIPLMIDVILGLIMFTNHRLIKHL